MLLITETGMVYSVVKDFDEDFLWVRSQDKESILKLVGFLESTRDASPVEYRDEPTWDYQFRVDVERYEWADFLAAEADAIQACKVKPAVSRARGHDHPVYKAVENLFYDLSYNRPDGSKPAWITGGVRRNTNR